MRLQKRAGLRWKPNRATSRFDVQFIILRGYVNSHTSLAVCLTGWSYGQSLLNNILACRVNSKAQPLQPIYMFMATIWIFFIKDGTGFQQVKGNALSLVSG
jgi:hypothetical protein